MGFRDRLAVNAWFGHRLSISKRVVLWVFFVIFMFGLIPSLVYVQHARRSYLHEIQTEIDEYNQRNAREMDRSFEELEQFGESLANSLMAMYEEVQSSDMDDKDLVHSDGAWRSTDQFSAAFLSSRSRLTPAIRHDFKLTEILWKLIGPAAQEHFFNVYMITTDNFIRIYPPEWALRVEADHDFSDDIFYYPATPENNSGKKPVWTPVYYDTLWERQMSSLLLPLYRSDGSFKGVLGFDFIMKNLYDFTDLINSNSSLYHTILMDRRFTPLIPGMKEETLPEDVMADLQRQDVDLSDNKTIFSGNFICNARAVGPFHWHFFTYTRYEDRFREFNRNLFMVFILLILSSAVLAIILRNRLYHIVLNRVLRLRDAVMQVEAGHPDVYIPVQYDDEIGVLERGVGSMASSIRRQLNQLNVEIGNVREANQSLARNQELLDTIASKFPNAYLLLLDMNYVILYAGGQEFDIREHPALYYRNRAFSELFGRFSNFFFAELEKTLKGKSREFSLEMDEKHYRVRTVPIQNEAGDTDTMLVVVENITFQKMFENQLTTQQYYLAIAQKIGRMGTWEYVPETRELIWTDEVYAIYEMKPGVNPDPADLLKMVHPNDQDKVDRFRSRSLQNGRPYDIDFRILCGRKYKWIREIAQGNEDRQGRRTLIGVIQDISPIRERDEELGRIHELYRTAIRNVRGVVYIRNYREDRYELIDEAIYDILETERGPGRSDEITPSYLKSYIREKLVTDPDYAGMTDPDRYTEDFKNGRRSRYFAELEVELPGSRKKWLSDSAIPLEIQDGRVIKTLGIIQDITEQKQLQIMFYQTQKMDSIGQLAGGIAHDFNNILTAQNGFTALLSLHLKGDKERRVLSQIESGNERAANLVRQLLAFSRKQLYKPQRLDMNEGLTNLTRMLRRMIPENIEISYELEEKLPCIQADPSQLEQLVINLVVNARDAVRDVARERKIILVRTVSLDIETEKPIFHDRIPPGSYVVLSVEDQGIGINEADFANIFEPFFTTKAEGQGTGLGLATVFGIIKQNRACIDVQSREGRGSCFTVYWPQDESGLVIEEAADSIDRPVEGGTESLLFVEDDELARVAYTKSLESLGYSVTATENGEETLQIYETDPNAYDLVISDLIMPRLSGVEMAVKMLALRPNQKILFCSGYSANIDTENFPQIAHIPFLQKPFTVEELNDEIRRLLEYEPLNPPNQE